MKFTKLALLATAMAAAPYAANAQDVGATVFGNDDAAIGTVTTNDGSVVTVDTGKHKAPLPANLLAEREGKWTVNATKAQIDQMMDAQVAAANEARDAALIEGAAVMSADGQPVGTVYTVDTEDMVIIKNDAGIITLTRDSFAADANGALIVLYSAADIASNTTPVPEGAEILTPAQARAKEAGAGAGDEAEAEM
ncbi:hypothetical protein SAMN06297468_0478 [Altererythrobacter xiamenensis]|uniref:PRC-barrel domain-containing protein n=1 Tax=Altererythrobacter xiamenensis TaxID=1316679 RepID=A0A1Y6EKX7_9SPHN|nr:hypothetical protein [Altererythrobacter xiamenensis]SMQ60833.1 hypothetical protein SAMN06297468_0478 [Altererythrobacter xiamenensis]